MMPCCGVFDETIVLVWTTPPTNPGREQGRWGDLLSSD